MQKDIIENYKIGNFKENRKRSYDNLELIPKEEVNK